VPQIFIGGQYIRGNDDMTTQERAGRLEVLLAGSGHRYCARSPARCSTPASIREENCQWNSSMVSVISYWGSRLCFLALQSCWRAGWWRM
jgi:hypothetical protein